MSCPWARRELPSTLVSYCCSNQYFSKDCQSPIWYTVLSQALTCLCMDLPLDFPSCMWQKMHVVWFLCMATNMWQCSCGHISLISLMEDHYGAVKGQRQMLNHVSMKTSFVNSSCTYAWSGIPPAPWQFNLCMYPLWCQKRYWMLCGLCSYQLIFWACVTMIGSTCSLHHWMTVQKIGYKCCVCSCIGARTLDICIYVHDPAVSVYLDTKQHLYTVISGRKWVKSHRPHRQISGCVNTWG